MPTPLDFLHPVADAAHRDCPFQVFG
jgi:hypothetical protein